MLRLGPLFLVYPGAIVELNDGFEADGVCQIGVMKQGLADLVELISCGRPVSGEDWLESRLDLAGFLFCLMNLLCK